MPKSIHTYKYTPVSIYGDKVEKGARGGHLSAQYGQQEWKDRGIRRAVVCTLVQRRMKEDGHP
eukprot:m.354016 g.354016  ORF g.354016 m.354016 type:complete len:63 (+) comp16896_c0_seq1:194-382(+)